MRRWPVVAVLAVVVLAGASYAAYSMPEPEVKRLASALPARMPESKGRAYYVDGSRGSDAAPGTKRKPWRSINHALQRVPPGSRVFVRRGTYVGVVDFQREVSPRTPITLQPFPGEHVLLTAPPNSLNNTVYVYRAGGFRLRGFEITSPTSNGGIRIENSRDIEVVGCEIHHTGHGGLAVFGTGTDPPTGNRNVQVWRNRFHDNGGYWASQDPYWIKGDHSIYWGGVSNHLDGVDRTSHGGVIANNLFYNQPVGRALQIGSQVSGLIVTNNTFYRAYQPHPHAGTAIQVYGESNPLAPRNVVVVNNIIAHNAHYGVFGSGAHPVMQSNIVRNNLAWGNPNGDFRNYFETTSEVLFSVGDNITGEPPRFVAPYKLDFGLQRSSPAIDRADPAYAPRTDRTGSPRKGPPDLGAFEWIPGRDSETTLR